MILFMNRTKRKIFETSMNLFATKGYDATSIEEITSVVGVAKGTLYYHFSSKEEIFNFLVEEGMKLLQNSISIKIANCNTLSSKLKAILLIQIKVMTKYEDFMTIVLRKESRNLTCRKYVFKYIDLVEQIIEDSINNGEAKDMNVDDPKILASGLFGITYSILLYKIKNGDELNIQTLYKQYEKIIFSKYNLT